MSKEYWQNRYDTNTTGWDLGDVSPPLKAYFDKLANTSANKTARILIAGAGNAHEARYLHKLGFTDVYVLDIVPSVLDDFAKANPTFNTKHLICHDFFDVHTLGVGQFDIIIEQTFLCAIDPNRRDEYARQVHRLLVDSGRLVGLLYACTFETNPPYSGSFDEYQALFAPYFDTHVMALCYNSEPSRVGDELFMNLVKKNR